MKNYFVGAILLFVMSTGCESKEEIAFPYEGDKIVLTSFMQPDSLMYLRVTKSVQIGVSDSFNFPELPQAQVRLLEDNVPMAPFTWKVINGRGYFVSAAPVRADRQYTVQAAMTGFKSVEATDSLPRQPLAYRGHAQQGLKKIRFTLKDPGSIKNYYRIRVYSASEPPAGKEAVPQTIMPYRLDPVFSNNFLDRAVDSYYNTLVLEDERFNGRELVFVLEAQQAITTPYLVVEISALSVTAFKYLKTLTLQQQDGGSIITEPVFVYSNVENGHGVVAGINTRWVAFKVDP